MGDHQIASRLLSSSQIYNVIINSKQSANITERKYTTYDFAPTILEAMGFDIAKFGIGRSLFREEKTLFEKEGNKFNMLIASKNSLYDDLKKFDNTKALYKKYEIGKSLNNTELFNYSDFGEQNKWCNRTTYLSMTLDKLPQKDLYLKMRYFIANEPFKIFITKL